MHNRRFDKTDLFDFFIRAVTKKVSMCVLKAKHMFQEGSVGLFFSGQVDYYVQTCGRPTNMFAEVREILASDFYRSIQHCRLIYLHD